MMDVIAGQVQIAFETTAALRPQVQAGRVYPLAMTGSSRSEAFPDTPTMNEIGFPVLTLTSWYGVFVPTGVPTDRMQRLQSALSDALDAPDIKTKLSELGSKMCRTKHLGPSMILSTRKCRYGRGWSNVLVRKLNKLVGASSFLPTLRVIFQNAWQVERFKAGPALIPDEILSCETTRQRRLRARYVAVRRKILLDYGTSRFTLFGSSIDPDPSAEVRPLVGSSN